MKHLDYLRAIIAFAFRENPLYYLAVFVSLASVVIEIMAMASLMPLAAIASGHQLEHGGAISNALALLGIELSGRNLLLIFLALFTLRVVTQFAGQALVSFLSRRLFSQITTRAFHGLLGVLSIREIERSSIGSYISLSGDEAFRASALITHLTQLLSNLVLAGLYFLAIASFSIKASIAVVIFLVTTFVLMLEAFRASHRLGSLQVEQSHTAGSIFLDALNGLRTVRAHAAEQFVEDRYREEHRRYMRTLFYLDLISLLTRLGPALLLFCAAFVYVVVSPLSIGKPAEFAFFVTVVLLLMRFFPTVGQTVTLALKVISDARAGKDVTELVKQQRPYTARPTVNADQTALRVETVDVQNISFSHTPEKPVLVNVNMRLKSGTSYALIGRSGSGKSTLMDLLLRFYQPDSGQILINGVNAEMLDEGYVRQRILLVTQEAAIFNDTVSNNIRFGLDASDEEVMQASRIACVDEFIANLPNGFDTVLSYRGTNLSGGQRQRIGLARALLRRASVLLLDESTSALDVGTRSRVVKNLRDEYSDKILMFVTHDASVIASVDEVIDMTSLNLAEFRQ